MSVDNKDYSNKKVNEVKLRIVDITNEGLVNISFNQELQVPEKFNETIIEVELKINQDRDKKEEGFEFTYHILDWQRTWMTLHIQFDNPLAISQGKQKDQLTCTVVKTEAFKSLRTDQALLQKNSQFIGLIPKQLKLGTSQESLETQSAIVRGSLGGLTIIQLITSLFLKQSMENLLVLYLELQILAYTGRMYSLSPANMEFYTDTLISTIEFELIQIGNLIRMIIPSFNMESFILGNIFRLEEPSVYGLKQSLTKSLEIYITLLVYSLIIAFIAFCCRLFCWKKTSGFIMKHVNKFVWDRTIFLAQINALKLGSCAALQVQGEIEMNALYVVGIVLSFFLYATYFLKFIKDNKEDLRRAVERKKVSRITKDLALRLEGENNPWDILKWSCYAHPLFIYRRLLLIIVPMIIPKTQLWLPLMIMSITSAFIYIHSRPYVGRRYYMELINEFLTLTFCYLILVFTDLTSSFDLQFSAGYACGLLYIITIGTNLVEFMLQLIRKLVLCKYKRDKLKKSKEAKQVVIEELPLQNRLQNLSLQKELEVIKEENESEEYTEMKKSAENLDFEEEEKQEESEKVQQIRKNVNDIEMEFGEEEKQVEPQQVEVKEKVVRKRRSRHIPQIVDSEKEKKEKQIRKCYEKFLEEGCKVVEIRESAIATKDNPYGILIQGDHRFMKVNGYTLDDLHIIENEIDGLKWMKKQRNFPKKKLKYEMAKTLEIKRHLVHYRQQYLL